MGQVIYESLDPATGRHEKVETDPDIRGGVIITHHQDTRPILESAKRIASDFDPLVRRETTHVARIPIGVWMDLTRQGITRDQRYFNKWLDDPDNAVFRTDNRRKL